MWRLACESLKFGDVIALCLISLMRTIYFWFSELNVLYTKNWRNGGGTAATAIFRRNLEEEKKFVSNDSKKSIIGEKGQTKFGGRWRFHRRLFSFPFRHIQSWEFMREKNFQAKRHISPLPLPPYLLNLVTVWDIHTDPSYLIALQLFTEK